MRVNTSIIPNTESVVPITRTLTINGTSYDLSADRSWTIGGGGGSGTVTSVAMTVPTGLLISGSPITTSGTLAITFASGYAIPTTIKQSNWDDAYTFVSGFPSQTGNSGKFLTTNGSTLSWQEIFAYAPGGTTNQVQYNSAGTFAGAANVEIDGNELVFVDSAFPSAPASGRQKMFTDSMGGRYMMAAMQSNGSHYDFQPALFGSTTYIWLAGTGTTLAINWGTSFTARNSGTAAAQATPTKTSTSAITSMNRATFGTGSTATGASGIQATELTAWRGNAAGLGGFFFHARFALEATSGTYRMFVGLSANNATMAADASTWNNTIGLCKDSGDSTLFFLMRNTTTASKISTGVTLNTTDIYDLYIYCGPNESAVTYELRNAVTNASLATSANYSTNIPANTVFMYMQSHIQSATGTTAKLLALNRMYLETNL